MASANPTYDPEAIYAALVAHAESLHRAASKNANPEDANGGDDPGSLKLANDKTTQSDQVLAAASSSPAATNNLFLSSHLALSSPGLPSALPILSAVFCLIFGLLIIFFGAQSLRWGIKAGENKDRRWFKGGVGGVLGGLTFFASITSIIVLLIPHHTNLSSPSLYGILIPYAIVGAVLGGRFKYAGRGLLGASAGLATTFMLLATFHPSSLLPRLILLALFLPISIITTLILPLFFPKISITSISSRSLIVLTSFGLGPFLFASGVDLVLPYENPKVNDQMGKQLGWLDAVQFLVDTSGDHQLDKLWGKSTFKGCVAGLWILGAVGCAWQWWNWSKNGDDPDEQWNSYLGNYLNQITNDRFTSGKPTAGRKGVFQADVPWYRKIFSNGRRTTAVIPSEYEGAASDDRVESPLTDSLDEKKNVNKKGGRRSRGVNNKRERLEEEKDIASEDGDDEEKDYYYADEKAFNKHVTHHDDSESDDDGVSSDENRSEWSTGYSPAILNKHSPYPILQQQQQQSSPHTRDQTFHDKGSEDADEVGTLVGSIEFRERLDKFGGGGGATNNIKLKPKRNSSFNSNASSAPSGGNVVRFDHSESPIPLPSSRRNSGQIQFSIPKKDSKASVYSSSTTAIEEKEKEKENSNNNKDGDLTVTQPQQQQKNLGKQHYPSKPSLSNIGKHSGVSSTTVEPFDPTSSPSDSDSGDHDNDNENGNVDLESGRVVGVDSEGRHRRRESMVGSIAKMFGGQTKRSSASFGSMEVPPLFESPQSSRTQSRVSSDQLAHRTSVTTAPASEPSRPLPIPISSTPVTNNAPGPSPTSQPVSPQPRSPRLKPSATTMMVPPQVSRQPDNKVSGGDKRRHSAAAAPDLATVPATPSLLNALDRVSRAQREAREAVKGGGQSQPQSPQVRQSQPQLVRPPSQQEQDRRRHRSRSPVAVPSPVTAVLERPRQQQQPRLSTSSSSNSRSNHSSRPISPNTETTAENVTAMDNNKRESFDRWWSAVDKAAAAGKRDS